MDIDCAHNPLLPEEYFIPDVEAHVWNDGRIYLYGSCDIQGLMQYCSVDYHVFSSEDMVHWTDHGVAFSLHDAPWYDFKLSPRPALYAPDCAFRNGSYYLYYCVPDGRCVVAVSASPSGPFKDIGHPIEHVQGIDPAVLIDDDGQAYLYWGQFDKVRVARLKENMTDIEPDSIVQPLSVHEHEFHEGSSVKKIDGLYYYLFTDTHRHADSQHPRGKATCLGYAVSDNPMRGFVWKGIVIDNIGCDPDTWNNHGSLACFHGNWYVFYHRSTHASNFSRHVCVEPVIIRDGEIAEVPMTTNGAGGALPASQRIPAHYACGLTGNVRIRGANPGQKGQLLLGDIRPGDSAVYRWLCFQGEKSFKAALSADGECSLELYADDCLVGEATLSENRRCTAGLNAPVTGTHELRLRFTGAFASAELQDFTFKA